MSKYTNEVIASRFSEVMWHGMDKRVAAFLLEEAAIENASLPHIPHKGIANHLGAHREVVTRMLRYFQNEGAVKLARGTVELMERTKLEALRET